MKTLQELYSTNQTRMVKVVGALYLEEGVPMDRLPYTNHFENIFAGFLAEFKDVDTNRSEFWRQLVYMRKHGTLPNITERKTGRKDKEEIEQPGFFNEEELS